MKISLKLTLWSLTVIFLVIFIGILSFNIAKNIATTYSGLSEEFYEDVDAAIEVQSYAKRAEGHLSLYLSFDSKADKEKFFKRHHSLEKQIEILERVITTPGGKKQLENLKSASENILKYGNQLIEIYEISPETFDFRDHRELFEKFHDATSSARRAGVDIGKRRTLDAAIDASSYAKRAEGHLYKYLTLHAQAEKEKYFDRLKSFDEQTAILDIALKMPMQRKLYDELKLASEDIKKYGSELIGIFEANPETFAMKSNEEVFRKFHDSTSSAREIGVEIAKNESAIMREKVEPVKNKINLLLRNIIISITIIVFLLIGLSAFALHSILQPIKEFNLAALDISSGNLDRKVTVSANDEIGILGATFNEMTKQLKESQEKLLLKEKMVVLGQLSSSIGHELRNPLCIISNALFYLKMKLSDSDEKILKFMSIIQAELDRSNHIITNILDFSKSSKLFLTKSDINMIINSSLEKLEIPDNVSVKKDLRDDIPLLILDAVQIQQAFYNIANNAVQAMPDGGTLAVRTSMDDGHLEITFSDTGAGIDTDTMNRIFEPLFTTKMRGIGLGLAIVKGIIEKHKGSIEVKSEIGKGSSFIIKLPVSGV